LALVAAVASPARSADERSATATPETGGATAPWVSVLNNRQVQSVLGKEVRSRTDEPMGRIVDLLVDRNGEVRGAVIDFGGFLGVGSRKIVVDWNALHFSPTKPDEITVDLTRDQVRAAPEYKSGQPVVVLGSLPPILPSAPEM
jgi:hypothetical protein